MKITKNYLKQLIRESISEVAQFPPEQETDFPQTSEEERLQRDKNYLIELLGNNEAARKVVATLNKIQVEDMLAAMKGK